MEGLPPREGREFPQGRPRENWYLLAQNNFPAKLGLWSFFPVTRSLKLRAGGRRHSPEVVLSREEEAWGRFRFCLFVTRRASRSGLCPSLRHFEATGSFLPGCFGARPNLFGSIFPSNCFPWTVPRWLIVTKRSLSCGGFSVSLPPYSAPLPEAFLLGLRFLSRSQADPCCFFFFFFFFVPPPCFFFPRRTPSCAISPPSFRSQSFPRRGPHDPFPSCCFLPRATSPFPRCPAGSVVFHEHKRWRGETGKKAPALLFWRGISTSLAALGL